jgi:hypothetical protein
MCNNLGFCDPDGSAPCGRASLTSLVTNGTSLGGAGTALLETPDPGCQPTGS